MEEAASSRRKAGWLQQLRAFTQDLIDTLPSPSVIEAGVAQYEASNTFPLFVAARFVPLPIHSLTRDTCSGFVACAKQGQVSAQPSRDGRFRDKRIRKKVLSTWPRS